MKSNRSKDEIRKKIEEISSGIDNFNSINYDDNYGYNVTFSKYTSKLTFIEFVQWLFDDEYALTDKSKEITGFKMSNK